MGFIPAVVSENINDTPELDIFNVPPTAHKQPEGK